MRFIHEQQIVAGNIIEQRGRGFAGHASGEVARIIFNAVAVAHGLDHFKIEAGALMNALRLHHAALLLQFFFPPREFLQNGADRTLFSLWLHHVMRLGINRQPRILLFDGAKQRINLRQRLHFIAKQFNAVGEVVIRRKNLNHIAAHAKGPAAKVAVIALIEDLHKFAHDVFTLDLLALLQKEQHAVIGFGRSQSVDATHRRDNDAIAPLKQRARGRKPELIELVIDGRLFFDVHVAGGNVSLGLVVIVV